MYGQHPGYAPYYTQGYNPQTGLPYQTYYAMAPGYMGQPQAIAPQPVMAHVPSGMFTRNLIGSLSASAFRLTDTHNNWGIWFVLQDLSVRTEGAFR